MSEKIDLSERLFNLTCALLNTKIGLTKQEIFENVQGYKELYKPNGDNSSLNRMFERDKVQLSESGIKWRSFIPKEAMDDNQEYRYLIANEDFYWPKKFTPTTKQIALMNLAAQVWARASLSSDADRAKVRLNAIGDEAHYQALTGIAPRIRTHHHSFLELTKAIENRQVVSFDYRKANTASILNKKVEPWSLQNISGQWLLIGLDVEKQESRNYLLKRIVSRVKMEQDHFPYPDSETIKVALGDLENLISNQKARIKLKYEGTAWYHFGLAPGQLSFELNFMDLFLLAEELLEFADEIADMEPPSLKQVFQVSLSKVAELHA